MGAFPRFEGVTVKQDYGGRDVVGGRVESQARAVFQAARGGSEVIEVDINETGGAVEPGRDDDIAAQHLMVIHPLQVKGEPRAGLSLFALRAMCLDTTDSARQPGWQKFSFIAYFDRPGQERAGDDRAEACQSKDTVHRQAIRPFVSLLLQISGNQGQFILKPVKPTAAARRDRYDRSAFEKTAGYIITHLLHDQIQPVRINQVAFSQG